MSLLKSRKDFKELINEYDSLKNEISTIDLDIVKAINIEEKMMQCFYRLKELQAKYPLFCSIKENEIEFRKYLLDNLIDKYRNILIDIYKNNEKSDVLEKLNEVECSIKKSSYNSLSNEINILLKDLHKKIEDYDRYTIENSDGNIHLVKMSDDEYIKLHSADIIKRNTEFNDDYKLPSIELLDDESKNIIPIIEKIKNNDEKIMIPLGIEKDNIIIESINDMPNLLIGGTVMSGKSSFINTIIGSILLTKKPSDVKLLIYDSKRIEYSYCNGLPHLLRPVITYPNVLYSALQTLVLEIEHRYDVFEESDVKDINSYNKKIDKVNDEKGDNEKLLHMPNIIAIIDDYNSLNSNDEINKCIKNITGYGWKAGVHMIIVSNHPSARVIPTISKSNFPARLSFKVASSQSSQAILGDNGAEKLIGYGNALYISKLTGTIVKISVPNISESSMEKIVDSCFKQQNPIYDNRFITTNIDVSSDIDDNELIGDEYDDPLYDDIVEFVVKTGKASASLLQRRFKLGYNRAARVMDLLEQRGIIGPINGSKPREVLANFNNNDDDEIL